MAEYQKPPKHALNHPKLRLSAPNPNVKGKYANLSWDIYNNNPRIVVATNDPAFAVPERSYGRITAAMDTPTFGVFLDLIDQAVATPAPGRIGRIDNYTTPKGSSFGAPPVLASEVHIGRDQEGCVFISVVQREKEGWPIIKFIFSGPDGRFHKIFKGDNTTEFTKAEMSAAYAKSYVELLRVMLPQLLVANYVEPPPYVPKNGQGGGGGRGNGGGYPPRQQAPAAGGDDDFSDLAF